jgi:hypothetical protein
MLSTIIAIMFMGINNIVAVLPKELEAPKLRQAIKKSRGKGKGKNPYFAKFM